jgi:hypothetical protein
MKRRRIAVVAAGLLLVGGVITVLRTAEPGEVPRTTPTRAAPTSLKQFAADGVLVPAIGLRPARPERLALVAGAHRLQARWAGDSPGYEVRWGKGGALDRIRLVAQPAVQLDGLDDGAEYRIEVRAVDAYGQRSEAASATGTPRVDHSSDERYVLLDRFDGPDAPDPARWRLARRSECVHANAGDGDNAKRLVISSDCATDSAALRSRTPFALADGPELGRLVVETNAPGTGGQLLLDLVPGPVDLQDDALPPGAIRLRVTTDAYGTTKADVLIGADTTVVAPVADAVWPIPAAKVGMSHRWELVLRRDGVRALRDGQVIATANAVPRWREATALIGVSALAGDRIRAGVDLVAFAGKPARTPPLVPPPAIKVDVGATAQAISSQRMTGVRGGQLRLTLLPAEGTDPNQSVQVGGVQVPLRPAVAGSVWRPKAEYSAVADLPPEALVLTGRPPRLHVALPAAQRVQVTRVDLELAPEPGVPPVPPTSEPDRPSNDQDPELAEPVGAVLDASGQPPAPGAVLPRGRLVLDVHVDGLAGQRGVVSRLAGLAGFDVWVDDQKIASVPTAAEGPGVAGRWRLAMNTSKLSAGPHTLEIRAFSTESAARPISTFVPLLLAP